MKKTLESRVIVVGLILIFAFALSARAGSTLWTGDAGDNQWDNPVNWMDELVPSELDRAIVNGPGAAAGSGPVITEGTEAVTEILDLRGWRRPHEHDRRQPRADRLGKLVGRWRRQRGDIRHERWSHRIHWESRCF